MIRLLPLFLAATLGAGEAPFNGPDNPIYLGFRHNGTGVFPSDCTPVTTWKEGNWAWVEELADASADDPDDDEAVKAAPGKRVWVPRIKDAHGEHIVWKSTLPMWGHGGIALVKGRMFFTHEMPACLKPEEEKDFQPGPILVCMDPKDGAVLWTRCLSPLPTIPAGEQDKALKSFHAYVKWNYRRWHLVRELQTLVPKPAKNVQSPTPEDRRDRVRAIFKELRTMQVQALPEAEVEKILAGQASLPIRKGRYTPVIQPIAGAEDIWQIPNKYGFVLTGYSTHGSHVISGGDEIGQRYGGEGFQTPVSDGEHIYATTTNRTLFCFDMDGKQRWVVRYPLRGGWSGCKHGTLEREPEFEQTASPIIVDDKVIICSNFDPSVMAFSRKDGSKLWDVPGKIFGVTNPNNEASAVGHPALLRIGGEVCLFTKSGGRLIRARDGKMLLDKVDMGHRYPNAAVNDVGDTVFYNTNNHKGDIPANRLLVSPEFPGQLHAVRFSPDGAEAAKAEKLWSGPDLVGQDYHSPVFFQGRLYAVQAISRNNNHLTVLDPDSGKMITSLSSRSGGAGGSMKGDAWFLNGWCFGAAAGGRLYTVEAGRCSKGLMSVIALEDKPKVITADNHLLGGLAADAKPFSNYWGRFPEVFTGPYFSGNRIFIRAHEHVYCLGDPKEALRLSRLHQ